MVTTHQEPQQEQSEWDGLLEQDVAMVEPPSYMKAGEILNRPNEDNPLPLRVTDLRYKGYVVVWDTVTGVRALQPWWLLWQTMRKTREDGSLVFTRTDPQIPQSHGDDLFCPLNALAPEYARLKGMGFKDCRKQHIPHRDAMESHVAHCHKRAWQAIERDRVDRIREEDRQLQKDVLSAMTSAVVKGVAADSLPIVTSGYIQVGEPGNLASETVTFSNFDERYQNDTTLTVSTSHPEAISDPAFTAACPDCEKSFEAKSQKMANKKVRLHRRHCQLAKGAT